MIKSPRVLYDITRDHSVNARAIERANWPSFDHRHHQRESFVKCQINFVKFRVTFIYIHGDIGWILMFIHWMEQRCWTCFSLLLFFCFSTRKKRNELKTRVETKGEKIGIRLITSRSIGRGKGHRNKYLWTRNGEKGRGRRGSRCDALFFSPSFSQRH